jgi:small-conductance mechanosensitive channel
VTRLSRALIPLLVGVLLLLLHAGLRHRPDLLVTLELDPKTVLKIVLFFACLPLILGAVRLVDLLVFDVAMSRRTGVHAPILLREIVSLVLFLMLLGWALYEILGYEVKGIFVGGTVLAAVLGLALQETLGNLFAGIALHIEEDFQVGDVVRSGEFFGIVEAVRWRGTRLRTYNNNVVIVPNSLLARERIEVFPRNNMNARVLQIGLGFDVPPATAIPILVQAAQNVEGIVREMPCIARVGGFGESSTTYEIKYFTADYAMRDRIDADVRKAVWYALQRNGIRFPVPVRELGRIPRSVAHEHPGLDVILGRLEQVDFLSPVPHGAQQAIANAARLNVYSSGETIIREGSDGDSMFIVHQGTVSVRIEGREVARLAEGEFFGEMALLTGARRTADVVAAGDVVAIEIGKEALQPVLVEYPELAAAISARFEERRGSLAALAAPLHEGGSVLSRIRSYFGLRHKD